MQLDAGTSVVVDGKTFILQKDVNVNWTPAIGDTVHWVVRRYGSGEIFYYASQHDGATLIYVHQAKGDDRKWAVVAYYGDIPKSIYYEDLRPCAA